MKYNVAHRKLLSWHVQLRLLCTVLRSKILSCHNIARPQIYMWSVNVQMDAVRRKTVCCWTKCERQKRVDPTPFCPKLILKLPLLTGSIQPLLWSKERLIHNYWGQKKTTNNSLEGKYYLKLREKSSNKSFKILDREMVRRTETMGRECGRKDEF